MLIYVYVSRTPPPPWSPIEAAAPKTSSRAYITDLVCKLLLILLIHYRQTVKLAQYSE